jgi:LacI family transcriptional regulator
MDDGILRRVTIRHVAEDAGVSPAAVSKVLRDAYGVSEALRLKVQASIERLGYRPNVAARGMRGRTYTVGILLTDIDNPFVPMVISGIQDLLEESGYKALLGVGRAKVPLEVGLIESMIDFQLDGLILIAPRLGPETLDRYARQIPTVAIGHHEPQSTTFDTVNADDRRGAAIVVEEFLRRGYTDIGMISLDLGLDHATNVSDIREIGYAEALRAAGLGGSVRIVRMSLQQAVAERQMEEYLSDPHRPRAVFCWSDLHGVELRNSAARKGIRVPDDLAIAGFDNSSVAALPMIDLTSIDQDGYGLGRAAAEALLSRLGGRKETSHVLITPRLVVRSSS